MGIPVRELQERISSDEFTYWIAYDRLDPIGNIHQDYNAAMIAMSNAQVHSKRGKRYKLTDFVLDFEGRKRIKDPKAIFEHFKLMKSNGGN